MPMKSDLRQNLKHLKYLLNEGTVQQAEDYLEVLMQRSYEKGLCHKGLESKERS